MPWSLQATTTKAAWLNQVGDKWENFFYQGASAWELTEVPAEVKIRLVKFLPLGEVFQEGKWVSFLKLGSEWGM